MKELLLALVLCGAIGASQSEAKTYQRFVVLAPECNVSMPCEGGFYSTRAKKFIGVDFGTPLQHYIPKRSNRQAVPVRHVVKQSKLTTQTAVTGGSQTGKISYYHEGQTTAFGERFDPHAMTCAHKTLPRGTKITISYRSREVVCTVNDRGPYRKGRILDVSLGVAKRLFMTTAGVIHGTINW